MNNANECRIANISKKLGNMLQSFSFFIRPLVEHKYIVY